MNMNDRVEDKPIRYDYKWEDVTVGNVDFIRKQWMVNVEINPNSNPWMGKKN